MSLHDGRMLGYAEYGTPEGTPVFYFHGFPGSRLEWQLIGEDSALSALNIRIIAPDRPGYGLSDFKRGRKLLDWPEDVSELADKLLSDDNIRKELSLAPGYNFLQNYFISTDYPFHQVKLGNDLLLRYPTLA